MKIVCDNCATKYSIADEKVRGKVFKIRCKKCSHIIVVRGGADGSVEASRDPAPVADGFPGPGPSDEQQTMAARGAAGGAAGGAAATGDAVWHLVIDREQVGPMTPAEVRTKFSEGAVDVETYAWREGFGDWLRLGSIEDFRDLGGGALSGDEGSTRRTDSADLFAAAGGSDDSSSPPSESPGDLFGGGALFGAPSASAAPARQQRTSSPGFAAQQQASEPAAPSGGVDVRPMTGQRNENSVLFSLNNLQALATGGGGAKAAPSSSSSSSSEARPGFANSQTEGSGLIDIRAMAASTLAASPGSSGPSSSKGGDDLPGLGHAPVFSAMAAPILMPAAPSGPPKWMWAILGVGVAAVLGIVVVGILLLTHKPDAPVVAAGSTVATPSAVPSTAPAAAAAPSAAAAPAAAAAGSTPGAVAANDAKDDSKSKQHHIKSDHPATKVAKNDAPKAESATPPPAAAAPTPAAPPTKKGKHDELDDLLNGASPGDAPKKKSRAAASEEDSGSSSAPAASDLPDQLDKQQIVGGMGRIKGRVAACYDQFKVPGMANVSVTIGGAGRVTNASIGGAFAGTPTGDCVSRAVKSATFPKFKGAAQTINYPFILR